MAKSFTKSRRRRASAPATKQVPLRTSSAKWIIAGSGDLYTTEPVRVRAPRSSFYETSKRVFDVAAAGTLLVICAPLMAVIALILGLSGGPVIFAQTRVGRGGWGFRCYKFRSMVPDADRMKASLAALNHHGESLTFKMRNDPRVTRIGRLLRKTSLDELPQLWNVLRGDMSIVGPRPPLPSEVAWYNPRHQRRLEVRPGLTCLWQISGRGDIPFDEQVEMDIRYIERRGLLLDLRIVLRTVPAIVSGKGAY